jgi:hypothetical protein
MLLLTLFVAAVEILGIDGVSYRPLAPARAANVLIFVTTECPVANGYAPEIQRICGAYGAKGVDCLLVYEDVGVSAGDVRRHRAEFRYGQAAAAQDVDGSLAARVGATMTPEVAVIDRRGGVRYLGRIDNKYAALGRPRRAVTEHDLEGALDAVLSGRDVAASRTQAIGCFIVPPAMRRKSS